MPRVDKHTLGGYTQAMWKYGLIAAVFIVSSFSWLNSAGHSWMVDTMDQSSAECVVTCYTTATGDQWIVTQLTIVLGLVVLASWVIVRWVHLPRLALVTQYYSPPRYLFSTIILRE